MSDSELSPAVRLLRGFSMDSRDWEVTVTNWKLEPLLLGVMSELSEIVGKQEPLICIGDIAHDISEWVEAWKLENPDTPDTRPLEEWFPNQYSATVVTEKLIVNTWGTISRDSDVIWPEVTQVKALKGMSGISILARPGDVRADGSTATHHNIAINFTDGTSIDLPDTYEELTDVGVEKMSGLVPFFYERLSN